MVFKNLKTMKYLLFFLFFLKVSIFADLQWFQKGLYADFSKANFKNLSLRIEAIESIHPDIADYSGLAMVVVKSGVPKFFWPHDIEHDFVVKKVMEKYIRKAISQERLNNFTFFFCLHDQYQPKNDFGKFEIPVLVFTKHKNATDEIAIPDWTALHGYQDVCKNQNCDEYINTLAKKYPFSKRIPKAIWRGINSGHHGPTEQWTESDRGFMVYHANNSLSSLLDLKYSDFKSDKNDLDCFMKSSPYLGKKLTLSDQFKYQYLIDLDGWGCTYSRLYWILGSGSVCLKLITNIEQWYYRGLEENYHYIPIT